MPPTPDRRGRKKIPHGHLTNLAMIHGETKNAKRRIRRKMQQEITLVEEEEDLCEEEDALFDCKREEYFYLSARLQNAALAD